MKFDQSLEGKQAKITTVDGKVYEGTIADYIFPEDNEPEGIAAINVCNCPQEPGQWLGFNESDVESIEILS